MPPTEKVRPWVIDDHPISSCFYACVGFLTRRPLDRQWWGHNFVDVGRDERAHGGINLGAVDVNGDNSYGNLHASPLYAGIKSLYGIEVTVERHDDVQSYLAWVLAQHADSSPFLMPIPLCLKWGFDSLEMPVHHYAIAHLAGPDKIQVFDQYRSSTLSLEQVATRLQWFVDRYDYLTQFEVCVDPTKVLLDRLDLEVIYSQCLEDYTQRGSTILSAYVREVAGQEKVGHTVPITVNSLYTIPLGLRAELRFLAVHQPPLRRVLDPLLVDLERQWRTIVLRALANARAGYFRFTIASDLQLAAESELAYFDRVRTLLRHQPDLFRT